MTDETDETQGYCPKCESQNLKYEEVVVDGQDLHYPFKCQDCGAEGEEQYYADFTGFEVY